MAPFWKGYLRLSLVSCPVQLFPATIAVASRHTIEVDQFVPKTDIEDVYWNTPAKERMRREAAYVARPLDRAYG